MNKDGRLADRRILLVEDEYFIADEMAAALTSLGAEVVGPVPTCAEALALLSSRGDIDIAVLDINLQGSVVYPVADALKARNIPFVFATGFGKSAIPPEYRHVPRWEKPYDEAAIAQSLSQKV